MQSISYNTYCLKKEQIMASQELPSEFDVSTCCKVSMNITQLGKLSRIQPTCLILNSLNFLFQIIVVGTGLEESMVAASAARNGHSVLHVDTNDYYGETWAAFNFDGIQKWIEMQQETNRKHSNTSESDTNADNFRTEQFNSLLNENESLIEYSYNTIESDISNVCQAWHVTDEVSKKEAFITSSDQSLPNESDIQVNSYPASGTDESADSEIPSEVNEEYNNSKNTSEVIKDEHLTKKQRYCWSKDKIINCSRNFNLDLLPRLLFARGAMVDLLISSNISRYTEFKVAHCFGEMIKLFR